VDFPHQPDLGNGGYISVGENLQMGCYLRSDKAGIEQDMTRLFDRFPIQWERRNQTAGPLSGGEQQMLAIGRTLMSWPKLVLFDEPLLGLAPTSLLRCSISSVKFTPRA
jgi:branched-chain amino acid transport system ATP-binding protein